MNFWTAAQFQQVTQGRWVTEPAEVTAALTGVTIDSRAVTDGQVFVAVRGDRFDGHDFAIRALTAGARLVIVSRQWQELTEAAASSGAGVLLVDDTVKALQDLARVYRDVLRQGGVQVIAVTGSNGKTTTRQLIHAVLSATLTGTQSPKSFNNHLGVPLTLLAASPTDAFVAAEVGMNHAGEIAALGAILRPNLVVLTTIGTAHIGYLGSVEAIAREKTSLFQFIEPGGCVVIPEHTACQSLIEAAVPSGIEVVRFGESELRDATAGLQMRMTLANGVEVVLPMPGAHNVHNALAALAVGRRFGISDTQAAEALRNMPRPSMRMELTTIGTGDEAITVLNDAYNANPDSVRMALMTLEQLARDGRHRRCVIVLADMLELGDTGPQEHRRIGERIAALNLPNPRAVLIGKLAMFTAEMLARHWEASRVVALPGWTDDLPNRVAAMIRPGDLVLLKGSRGMALERLLPAMATVTC